MTIRKAGSKNTRPIAFSRVICSWAFLVLCVMQATPAWAVERVIVGNAHATPLAAGTDPKASEDLADLRRQVTTLGTVRIIVGVRAAFAPEGLMTAANAIRQHSEIASAQSVVLNRVASLRQKPATTKRFETIPFMALEVTPDELEALANLTEVTSIQADRVMELHLAESTPLIGANSAWASGFTGAGQTLAILDTGVDKAHLFLSGKVVSEACYSTNYAPHAATSVCPGGVTASTATGSAVPYASGVCPAGMCNHGTHVAGIAAGANSSFAGVAKGSSVIAVQVFSRVDDERSCGGAPPCVLSYTSDQVLGLERVYALRGTYSIAAVNMSLGGGSYSSQLTCDSDLANAPLKTAIDNLRTVNIATVIASGNAGYTTSMAAPACISSAISVGATWDSGSVDSIASYSNSAWFLSLLAPGSSIYSATSGANYAAWQGTSMAAPHVAGAWAVLKQKMPAATVGEVLAALSSSGVSVLDTRNGITKPRINLFSALGTISTGVAYTLSVNKAGAGAGSVTSSPAGIACGTSCSASFASGSLLTLMATPDGDSVFTGWSGACTGTGSCSASMSSAKSVTANFAVGNTITAVSQTNLSGATSTSQYFSVSVPSGASNLVVKTSGGAGDVDLYVRASAVPTTTVYDCRPYIEGNTETCTFAAPLATTYYIMLHGYSAFSGVSLTASYKVASPITYSVTINKSGRGAGTVTSSPAGISCGSVCSALFPADSVMTLIATPDLGSVFLGWSGACSGSGICTLSVNTSQTIGASFSQINQGKSDLTPIIMLLFDDD